MQVNIEKNHAILNEYWVAKGKVHVISNVKGKISIFNIGNI